MLSAGGDYHEHGGAGGPSDLEFITRTMSTVHGLLRQLTRDAGSLGTPRDSESLRASIRDKRGRILQSMRSMSAAMARAQRDPEIQRQPAQRAALAKLVRDNEQLSKSCAQVFEDTEAKMRRVVLQISESLSVAQDNPLNAAVGHGDVHIQFQQFGDVDHAIMEEQEQEATAIAAEAAVLRNLFADVQQQVVKQGEDLTQMEQHMEQAETRVDHARVHLDKAADYNYAYRRKCLFFWVCFLLVVGVIVLIIVLTKK